MSQAPAAHDSVGEVTYQPNDFPLTIGGKNADIPVPGIPAGEPLAVLGVADKSPFIQPGPQHRPILLNGNRLEDSQWLQHGDVLHLGETRIVCNFNTAGLGFKVSYGDPTQNTLPPLETSSKIAAPISPPPLPEEPDKTIQPITFVLPELESSKPTRGLKPLSVILLLILLTLGGVAWYLFTAKSIRLEIEPVPDRITVEGTLLPFSLGGRYLLRPGTYTLKAEKTGYHSLTQLLEITEAAQQTFSLKLDKLPGLLTVISRPVEGAQVFIDTKEVGQTPLANLEIAPGEHELVVRADRYLEYQAAVTIEGAAKKQALEINLTPGWAAISLSSSPSDAHVLVDGEEVGLTPLTAELAQGEREVELKLKGYKTWQQRLKVVANEPQILPQVNLQEADGRVLVGTTPEGANVTLDGKYQGQTPLELAFAPGSTHSIGLTKAGYQLVTHDVEVKAEEEKQLNVQLKPNLGTVKLVSRPDGAVVYVDGVRRGSANQRLRLTAVPHMLEIKKAGYASQKLSVTPRPGFEQELSITLQSLAQRQAAATPTMIKTHAGQELRLIKPGQFTMGASRREQGRRANEVRYPVKLTRAFYLGTKEVTNTQFRQFQAAHSSGIVQNISLDIDSRPVVRVSWEQAIRYCNWLSRQDGLPLFYVEQDGKLVAAQPVTLGYRLPTEAEWAWAARFAGGTQAVKFPWGKTLPPAEKSGNYADESAGNLIADTLNGYNDGYPASAPVGTYPSNSLGLFDLGGNVAEWIHDFYSFGPNQTEKPSIDPMGPAKGQYHVIRGSSWMHASISELRLTYRDYGDKARPDVGFRIARYAQLP